MFIASVGGIVVSLLAVILLFVTIRQGRQMVESADDAVSETRKANDILRQEQRPWLALENDVGCNFVNHGHGGAITWNYDFYNKGKGPAHDISLRYTLIKRAHFQGMKVQLRSYLESVLTNRSAESMAVLFAEQTTDFVKYEATGRIKFQEDDFSADIRSSDREIMMMTCLTYRLRPNSDEFGFDVRMFWIEESDRWVGPWGHTIKEFGGARLIG